MPPVLPTINTCPACGEDFQTGGRDRPKRTQVYCSMECQKLARFRRGTMASVLKPTDAAYIAGFVDGEGSIMLYRRDSGSVSLRVTVTNTDREVLDWIALVCGVGSVQNQAAGTERRKASYCYQTDSLAARSLIAQLAPYLRVKAKQARLAIKFFDSSQLPALKADRSWQYAIMEQMRLLNRRGGEPVPTAGG